MSKFIEKLKRISQVVPQPMGFRRVETAKNEASLLFVAKVTKADVKGLADYLEGADAGLVSAPEAHAAVKMLQEVSPAAPGLLWGYRVYNFSAEDIKQTTAAGGDFIIFPTDSPSLDLGTDSETGKILEIDASIDERLLRTVDDLPVDAILLTDKSSSLTWGRLMQLWLFSSLISKPLLAAVPAEATAKQLELLWEAGIDGVVLEVGMKAAPGLKELKEETRQLNLASPRKQKKPVALVPRLAEAAPPEVEEAEPEEPE